VLAEQKTLARFNDINSFFMSRHLTPKDFDRMYFLRDFLKDRSKIIDWFSPVNFFTQQADILGPRMSPETGKWPLTDPRFERWEAGFERILWVLGLRTPLELSLHST
jgi:hypothetical protein